MLTVKHGYSENIFTINLCKNLPQKDDVLYEFMAKQIMLK
jgi:hypothetical protein